jgi:DNA-directed RNA polymerase specialized sigma24 family protein
MSQVQVFDARKHPDFNEDEGGRWITFCDPHGQFCQHETRSLARAFAQAPEEWCSECQKADQAGEPVDLADQAPDTHAELADHEDLVAESFALLEAVVAARAAQDREALDEALYAARVAGYSLDDLAQVIGVGRRSTVHYRVARHAAALGQPMPTGRATLALR